MSSTGSSVSTSGLVLPSTPLAEPGKEVPLVVNTPNRAKPPRHWIDLSIEERVQAVKDFGVPAFRARQISAHVFERWEVDPTQWTDLPKAARQEIADAWFRDEYLPVVEALREADLVCEEATDADGYLRVAEDRYMLLRTHEWGEDIIERLRSAMD